MPDQTQTREPTNRPTRDREQPASEKRQANDTGNAVLDSDRDVMSKPVRSPDGLIDETAAPIPPPANRDGDYNSDPASKGDKAEE